MTWTATAKVPKWRRYWRRWKKNAVFSKYWDPIRGKWENKLKPSFKKIAVLGLGLIGGSLALDLKRRKLARQVVGYNRSSKARRVALRRKACDAVFADPAEAVRDADLVVLATPVRHIPALARQIRDALAKGAIVTDVGSTKGELLRSVQRSLGKKALLVGGHPIAGTEHQGMAAAVENLFKDRWWIFTPRNASEQRASHRLASLVKALGAKPQWMTPRAHDETLAFLSHLPHMLAFSLMNATSAQGSRLELAGSSFRDATRVAASSADMWRDIGLDNRRALQRAMRAFEKQWSLLKKKIAAGDAKALSAFFSKAAKTRSKM